MRHCCTQPSKKVSEDYEAMKFNTAIAAMMTYVNEIYKCGSITSTELKTLLLLLNPVSPHITEEMWQIQGFEGRVYQAVWPVWDESKLLRDEIEIDCTNMRQSSRKNNDSGGCRRKGYGKTGT